MQALPTRGQEWISPDGRSQSMGNAGVAVSDDPVAGYWNPSSLARRDDKWFEFQPLTLGFSLYGASEGVISGDFLSKTDGLGKDIRDSAFSDSLTRISNGTATAGDVQTVFRVLNEITHLDDEGPNGAVISRPIGLDVKIGPVGLFLRRFESGGAQPTINLRDDVALAGAAALATDLSTLPSPPPGTLSPQGQSLSSALVAAGLTPANADKLAFQSQLALGNVVIGTKAFQNALSAAVQASIANLGTLQANSSGFNVRAMTTLEVGGGLAVPIIPHELTFGIALKTVSTETTSTHVSLLGVATNPHVLSQIETDLQQHDRTKDYFEVDLGLTYQPLPGLSFGVTGRNLLPVSLSFGPGMESVRLEPQARAGVLYQPLHWLRLGLDADLTRNDYVVVPGFKSQTIGGGAEVDLSSVFKIRAGAFGNLDTPSPGPVPTMGFGVKLFGISADVGVQVYPKFIGVTERSDESSPRRLPLWLEGSLSISAALMF
jgi:hypothetical protein